MNVNIPTPTLDALIINPRERKTLSYARGRDAIHADANAYVEEMARHNQAAAKTIGKKAAAAWVPVMKRELVKLLGGVHENGKVIFKDDDGTERIAKY